MKAEPNPRPFSVGRALLLAASLGAPPAPAQEAPSLSPPQTGPSVAAGAGVAVAADMPTAGAHSLTRADLEAWLDGLLPYALQRGDVAGAVVVVVKGGEVLLQKGYGYADVAARKPVDPERTLFRPGSVAKLFTWTAVMQLVEQGKLDLDADVNSYLDFAIPPRAGKPITLRNLMTHTGGFDEAARALIVTDPADMASLEQGLKRWIPPRIADAGSTPSYSNYGAALAGYIVQRVSGEAFDDYIERHIFAPLGMQHSTFRQPLPKQFEPEMSKGYKLGSEKPKPYELVGGLAPAGALAATGADMGRFMIAHLQGGALGSNRILRDETTKQMHGTAFDMIPPLNRMLLGFYENDTNGHRVVTHAGDTQWFHSELNLFVDDGVGLFLSLNSLGKEAAAAPIRSALFEEWSDRYLPGPLEPGTVDSSTAKAHAQQLAGRYYLSRRGHTTFFAVLGLLSQVKVVAKDDGTITLPLNGLNSQPKEFTEIAPYVWRNVAGSDRIAASVENGRVLRFGYDPFPFMLFEPVPWWARSTWLLPLWLLALAALAATALAWPVTALIRRRYGVAYGLTGRDARAHRLARIASTLVVATTLAVAATFGLMASGYDWAGPGMDGWIRFVRLLSLVVFVGGGAITLWNALLVLRSQRGRLAKLWSLVLALSCLTVLWVGIVFRIVGVSANY